MRAHLFGCCHGCDMLTGRRRACRQSHSHVDAGSGLETNAHFRVSHVSTNLSLSLPAIVLLTLRPPPGAAVVDQPPRKAGRPCQAESNEASETRGTRQPRRGGDRRRKSDTDTASWLSDITITCTCAPPDQECSFQPRPATRTGVVDCNAMQCDAMRCDASKTGHDATGICWDLASWKSCHLVGGQASQRASCRGKHKVCVAALLGARSRRMRH